MERTNKGLYKRIKWIYKLTKHGLFWQGVRNNLARIGIDVMPYYYFIATKKCATPQKIKGKGLKLNFSVFDENDMRFIKSSIRGLHQKDFINDLKNGDICLGFKENNEIIAYSLIRHKSFYFRGRYFSLDDSDIYIHSTYVFDAFRGNNIASFMKYERFKLFEKENVYFNHSITEFFNKPALKIQHKFNSKPIALYLSIILFRTWTMNFTLKRFNQEFLNTASYAVL